MFEFILKWIFLEMGILFGWECFVGLKGKVLVVDIFGVLGIGVDVMKLFGFIEENVVV